MGRERGEDGVEEEFARVVYHREVTIPPLSQSQEGEGGEEEGPEVEGKHGEGGGEGRGILGGADEPIRHQRPHSIGHSQEEGIFLLLPLTWALTLQEEEGNSTSQEEDTGQPLPRDHGSAGGEGGDHHNREGFEGFGHGLSHDTQELE